MPFVGKRVTVLAEIDGLPVEIAGKVKSADPLTGCLYGVIPTQGGYVWRLIALGCGEIKSRTAATGQVFNVKRRRAAELARDARARYAFGACQPITQITSYPLRKFRAVTAVVRSEYLRSSFGRAADKIRMLRVRLPSKSTERSVVSSTPVDFLRKNF